VNEKLQPTLGFIQIGLDLVTSTQSEVGEDRNQDGELPTIYILAIIPALFFFPGSIFTKNQILIK